VIHTTALGSDNERKPADPIKICGCPEGQGGGML
jgi:hypothetical protein